MQITDAQVHVWAASTPERPWPAWGESRAQRPVPLEADELIAEMDGAGVARTVMVPPAWEGDRNDVALAAAAAHPDRLAVMGRVNLLDADSVDLTSWLEQPGMLGIRVSFTYPHLERAFLDGSIDWFWPAAQEARVPIMVFAPGHTSLLEQIAIRHPQLHLIIDHLNLGTELRDGEIVAALEPLWPLARLDNVAVKVSALPCLVSEPYPFASVRPHIKKVVESFGPARSMWGSDLSRLPCAYGDWVRAVTEDCDFLSTSDLEWIMGRSLSEWLSWPVSASDDAGL